ncbi:unnamed protein product [Pleuronectes platessa]|uniref:Uncharacterized protein n=1 Tax=Pleuronectes platessa TaxID=8262 RepID=A0A9N7ZC62_PLEPL|nr:unnamed protein product [Pleuronectes platessa]
MKGREGPKGSRIDTALKLRLHPGHKFTVLWCLLNTIPNYKNNTTVQVMLIGKQRARALEEARQLDNAALTEDVDMNVREHGDVWLQLGAFQGAFETEFSVGKQGGEGSEREEDGMKEKREDGLGENCREETEQRVKRGNTWDWALIQLGHLVTPVALSVWQAQGKQVRE